MRTAIVVIATVSVVSIALGLTQAIAVEPRTAAWSGWTRTVEPNDKVSQIVTCNFDELDSTCYVELFAGEKGNGGAYQVKVYDGITLVAQSDDEQQGHDHSWVRFDPLTMQSGQSFTKGKQYEFRFTRAGSDSINYYWDAENPYPKYGWMKVGGTDEYGLDLCMRAYGQMDVVDSTYWGFNLTPQVMNVNLATLQARAQAAGVGMSRTEIPWTWLQPRSDSLDTIRVDQVVDRIHDDLGCEMVGMLAYCPKWASSRIGTILDSVVGEDSFWHVDTSEKCPPRNLFADVWSDSNYWARYVDIVVKRYRDRIKTWECWNEPHMLDADWQFPDTPYYFVEPGDTAAMCSLYLRLCVVADSIIDSINRIGGEGDSNRLLVLSVSADDTARMTWTRDFYEFATAPGGPGIFWDGVSAHPYDRRHTPVGDFNPTIFEAAAETLRTIMREYEDTGALWITEMGWRGIDTVSGQREMQARNLAEVFVTAKATEALPFVRFGRMCWYSFLDGTGGGSDGGYGAIDTNYAPKPSLYASGQAAAQLVGRRLNQRVLLGDARDEDVRIYEFEDPDDNKRMWVCWKNGGATGDSVVDVPVRSDDIAAESLDYIGTPPPYEPTPGANGWLTQTLTTRPVFITETGDIERPDLVVDSVRLNPAHPVVGCTLVIHAWVSNDSSAVPESSNIVVKFYYDDSLLGYEEREAAMDMGDTIQVMFTLAPVPESMHGAGLFSVKVNPEQDFVELGMDDNAGYQYVDIPRPVTGSLDIIVPVGFTNIPLPLLKMYSHSLEQDPSGETPADLARLKQLYWGMNDSLQDSTVTDWFLFTSDTAWPFMHGQGKYRFLAQYRDDENYESPWYYDPVDSFVRFDSTPPVGTFVLDDGARFTTVRTCSIMSAMSDTLSGLHQMRFGNSNPENVLANPQFVSGDGGWTFSDGLDYNSLQMAELPVSDNPEETSYVYQDLDENEFTFEQGDSLLVHLDLVVSVPEADENDTVAVVRLWYVYHDESEAEPDSWHLVGQSKYPGGTWVRCGTDPAEIRAELPGPPDAPWAWVKARVEVKASGPGAPKTGTVWADNVTLAPYWPTPDYSDWQAYADRIGDWSLPDAGQGHMPVHALYQDSTGVESWTALCDSIIFDDEAPVIMIEEPEETSMVSSVVGITGWAYDPEVVEGDTFFDWYRLDYRHNDSTSWEPVDPDSVSFEPAWPDWGAPTSEAVPLGDWDTEELADGEYWIRLTAADSAGNEPDPFTVQVNVDNEGGGDGGGGEGMMDGPSGGGIGMGEGSILVGSRTGYVLHLGEDMSVLDTFCLADSGGTALVTALVGLDDDSLLAVDARTHELYKTGYARGERRRLAGNLGLPSGLSRDEDGNLWLSDQGRSLIARYSPSGGLLFTRGGADGDTVTWLDQPEGLVVRNGYVYVADTRNNRLAVWDTAGNWVTEVKGDFSAPQAVAVTPGGQMYVVDKVTGEIQGLNCLGERIYTIADYVSTAHRFLVMSRSGKHLYSFQPRPNRVIKYRIKGESLPGGGGQQSGGSRNLPLRFVLHSPRPNPTRRNLGIRYGVPWTSHVTMRIYDITGRETRVLVNADQKPGWYDITWDRRDDKGRRVPAGVYFCMLETPDHTSVKKAVLVR